MTPPPPNWSWVQLVTLHHQSSNRASENNHNPFKLCSGRAKANSFQAITDLNPCSPSKNLRFRSRLAGIEYFLQEPNLFLAIFRKARCIFFFELALHPAGAPPPQNALNSNIIESRQCCRHWNQSRRHIYPRDDVKRASQKQTKTGHKNKTQKHSLKSEPFNT